MIGSTLFSSGVMLSYSQSLNFTSATILILLALPELMGCLLLLPSAFLTRRFNIKTIGILGILLGIFGYVMLIGAAYNKFSSLLLAFAGASLFGIGAAMFNSGWNALIVPLIDRSSRGRFLGQLRFWWQLASIAFSFIALSMLKVSSDTLMVYTIILSLVVVLQLVRLYLYKKIPDESVKEDASAAIGQEVISLIKHPIFMSYCCYLFFLTLFTAACPWIINLSQRQFLGFSESQIIFVNTLLFFGNLLGFYLGGVITDKMGTKPVFILAHFGYGIILLLFVGRDFILVPHILSHSILMFAFGVISAASSIAITAELYDVMPINKVLIATSFFTVVVSLSKFLGAFVSSQSLKLKLLTESWVIGPFAMNNYDTMLICDAFMVVMLVMTLGLIPSVSKQIHTGSDQ